MIRRPPRSTLSSSSAASDVYKRQHYAKGTPSSSLSQTPTGCKRTVSGTISLPCSGYFSPFPHGTGSLSVSQKYLALPDGPGSFNQDFSCPDLLRIPIIL